MAASNDQAIFHSTGTEITHQSQIWEIKNFSFIAQQDRLISSQRMYFNAMDRTGQSSQWVVFLTSEVKNGRKVIGVYYNVYQFPPSLPEYFYSRMNFSVMNNWGQTTWRHDTKATEISNMKGGWGSVIDFDILGGHTNLEIHMHFELLTPAKQTDLHLPKFKPAREESLMKFEMMETAREDMARLLRDPIPGDAKIRSKDGKMFTMPRGILAARSRVFQAMFRTDMRESNSGIVQFPDMTGKALEVLLHFIYTGELHPNWKEGGVIVELTNAAAKYQLLDLLDFLDFMMGKVCELSNVAELLTLANRLQLKTAEVELLKFVREKGTSSPGNFYRIMNSISGMGALNL